MPRLATQCICCDEHRLERQSAILMPFVARRALGWEPCEITPAWGLRDLPTGQAQALCATLHCPRCGMLFVDMRFDDAEMERLYDGYRGPLYEAMRESLEPGYAERNRHLLGANPHLRAVEAFLSPWLPDRPAVLDWGGDTGLNTPLRHRARLHHVLDISGRSLIEGAVAIADAAHAKATYDLIVLSNVLEHLPEPAATLAQLVTLMRSTGASTHVYIEVPYESLMRAAAIDPRAWIGKRHWHEHINFFSPQALRTLLGRQGLAVRAATEIELPDSGGALQLAMLCTLA